MKNPAAARLNQVVHCFTELLNNPAGKLGKAKTGTAC
jgi:hypothetical protein